MSGERDILLDPRVAVMKTATASYDSEDALDSISGAFERAGRTLGWSTENGGPLGGVIPPNGRVLVKPNLVSHANLGPWGLEPLITNTSLVRVVVDAALRAGAAEVLVGDAPIQGCDFEKLISSSGLAKWSNDLQAKEPRFKGLRDFRRTTCRFVDGIRVANEDVQPAEQFSLFDLGSESLLEPVTNGTGAFRVTCYDPRLMRRTHSPGRHQYLVANDVLDADVVINLPKLKTHMKAGITCALKNLIGINGNKEYLPHHRIGGSVSGGDCYPGVSRVKRALEFVFDRQNMTNSAVAGKVLHGAATQLYRILRLMGDHLGIEGSWSGNDTVWRTCLDLNRILLYGDRNATLADRPQRRVIHVVDAVVAGQGNGPLAPQPLPLGLVIAGTSAAAVDWLGAMLLGYIPERVPLVSRAFDNFPWPLATFGAKEVSLLGDLGTGEVAKVIESWKGPRVIHPPGWRDVAVRDADENQNGYLLSHALAE